MAIETASLVGIFLVAYFVSIFGTMAGIGGGPILVPLYSFIGGLETRQAVVFTVTTVIGSSFVRSLYYLTKRQKNVKNRYLINYSIVKLIVPFGTNTSYIGLLLNENLPRIVLFVLFVGIMQILIYKAVKKMLVYWKKVLSRKKKPKVVVTVDGIDVELGVTSVDEENGAGETFRDIIQALTYALVAFGFVTFFTFMRNGSDMPWLIYLIQLILVWGLGHITVLDVKQIYQWRKMTDFNFVNGDIRWNSNKAILMIVIMASVVGMLGAMLGIGGGVIITPILMSIGVAPDTVVATGSLISFFTSTSATLQFLAAGEFVDWYLVVIAVCGGFGAVTALIITYFLKKGLKLIIVTALAFVLIVSYFLLIAHSTLDMVENGLI